MFEKKVLDGVRCNFFPSAVKQKIKKILELYKYVRKVEYRHQKILINFKVAALQTKKNFFLYEIQLLFIKKLLNIF